MMISYGYSVKEHDDPYLDVVEAAVNGFSECTEPGAYLVDLIPLRKSRPPRRRIIGYLHVSLRIVRHVPDWFPGAGWKAKAKRFADLLTDMTDMPHQFVRDQMVSCGSFQKGYAPSIALHPYPRARAEGQGGTNYLARIIGFRCRSILTFVTVGCWNGCSVVHVRIA